MNDNNIMVSHCSIMQLNHIMRNRLNSLLGFIDLVCNNDQLSSEDRNRYLNVIDALSNEIYNNLDEYLDIQSMAKKI